MDSISYECIKQRDQYHRLLSEGYVIADDRAALVDSIGTLKSVDCYCDMWTPRLLCKIYVKGTQEYEESFHLVPLHQIVRWSYQVPEPGQWFTADFVIGTRKVGDQKMVPALRLPLR